MIETFQELELSDDILSALADMGYTTPTPVQVEAVPAIRSGRDVVIQSQTGTGKTAAFAIPIAELLQPAPGRVDALILTPTRELARQVSEEFNRIGARRGVRSTAVYGGASFDKQVEELAQAQVVIATPGRLLDLMKRGRVTLANLRIFGLDEADEMLSMGFERELSEIVSRLPEKKQGVLCSATISADVRRLSQHFIRDPLVINVSGDAVGALSVDHTYFRLPADEKPDALRRLLVGSAVEGAIIFANTRAETFRVHAELQRNGFAVDVLNGDLSQNEREAALRRMRDDSIRYLVATDVAARGIDISGLPAVINYDMPEAAETYVHRTGRTGRAGQFGTAFSLLTPGDITVFHQLLKFYRLPMKEGKLPAPRDVQRIRVERYRDEVLATLDVDGRLPYASYLPIARRLADGADSVRTIAKLIAFYTEHQDGAPRGMDAPEPTAPEPRPRFARGSEAPASGEGMALPVAATEESPAPAVQAVDPRPAATASDVHDRPAPKFTVPDAPAAPSATVSAPSDEPRALSSDAVWAWLSSHLDDRGQSRWRTSYAIARELDAPEDAVEAIALADARLERADGPRPMWRIRPIEGRPATGPADAAAVPSAQPPPPRASRPPRAAPARMPAPVTAEPNQAPPTAGDEAADAPAPRASGARRGRPRETSAPAPAPAVAPVHAVSPVPAPPPAPARESSRPAAEPVPAAPIDLEQVESEFVELHFTIGRREVAEDEALLDWIIETAGFDPADLGKVKVLRDRSFVEVRRAYWRDFVAALHNESFGDRRVAVSLARRHETAAEPQG